MKRSLLDTDDLGQRLVLAGKREGPSADSLSRAAAVAKGALALAPTVVAPATYMISKAALTWLGVSALVGVTGVAVVSMHPRSSPSPTRPNVVASAVAIATDAPPRPESSPAIEPTATGVAPELRNPAPEASPRKARPGSATLPETGSRAAAARDDALLREIGLVERVHERVAAGDTRAALTLLDSYDAEFAHGQMAEEAAVLRIQALLGEGQEARARELAHVFLAKHGASPLAERVRSLLGE
jgi:hypothetical protein